MRKRKIGDKVMFTYMFNDNHHKDYIGTIVQTRYENSEDGLIMLFDYLIKVESGDGSEIYNVNEKDIFGDL